MTAKRALAGLILSLAAAPAAAQSWAVTVTSAGTLQSSDLQQGSVNQVTGTAATVSLTCQTGVDCSKVSAQLKQGATVALQLGRSPANSDNFQVPSGVLQGTVMNLDFTLSGKDLGSFPVTAATPSSSSSSTSSGTTGSSTTSGTIGSTSGSTSGTSSGSSGSSASSVSATPSLAEMLTTSCDPLTVTVQNNGDVCVSGTAPNLTIGYDRKANCGAMVVSPVGNVLARAVNTFDENDELRVIVYGDARLLPTLKVERTSGFRDQQTVRIVGAGTQLPSEMLARQSAGVCSTAEFRLNDFSPGEGTFQISSYQGEAWTSLASVDFNIDALYSGMFSLGAAWTDVVDPDYKVGTNSAGDSVIVLGDDSKNDLLYTLFYTPFVWGKRDLEKRIPWYQHVNPTLGIVPQDIDTNAMIGITVDLPQGILFTVGRHFRRITTLPSSTGLSVGSSFSGTSDTIPTAESWQDDNFFAVTIDLRAAVQLFTVAFGSSSSSGSN